MAATLKLYVDWFNKRLQKSLRSAERFEIPPLYQGDVVPFQIQIVEPDPDGDPSSFLLPSIDNMAIKMAISDTPTGSSGGPSPFATNYASWTKDTLNKTFTGYLALNTSDLNTFLGALPSKDAYLEIEITEDTGVTTIYQGRVTIYAEVIESTLGDVAPGQTPLSLEVALQMFARFINVDGRTISFTSPDGTYQRTIGQNDDGSALDTTETL